MAGYRQQAYRRLEAVNGAHAVHLAYVRQCIPAPSPRPVPPGLLAPREWDVLRLLALGVRVDGIADALCISPSTVKTHIGRLYARIGARSAPHAVGIAHRCEILLCCPTCRAERPLNEGTVFRDKQPERDIA
jgi:DNA-binding CsgD family transcriptional regulator